MEGGSEEEGGVADDKGRYGERRVRIDGTPKHLLMFGDVDKASLLFFFI